MAIGTCNKCGQLRELALAGCVCAFCSRTLDENWANSDATDWVLVAFAGLDSYGDAISSIAEAVDDGTISRDELKEAVAENERAIAENRAVPRFDETEGSGWEWPRLYLYRNTTYVEMKSRWATSNPPDSLCIGPMTFDEIAEEGNRPKWPNGRGMMRALPYIRPANVADLGLGTPSRPEPTAPRRGLSQVAGMAKLKEQLTHEVLGPFRHPELYRRYRVSLPNGILFYGPPGCGKTYIARSLADELGWSFQYCRPSDVASPYIHDTVSKIRAVFSTAIKSAPSIVFIDEFEAFVPARSELGGHQQYKAEEVNEFLANLEGCAERKVLVIAATNEPEKIDAAVRRSGRFDKLILIPAPDAEARRAILEFHLRDRPVEEPLDAAGIAATLDGYSGSDIKLLVDEAARMALRRGEPISTAILLAALDRVPASITAEDMERYSSLRSRGT